MLLLAACGGDGGEAPPPPREARAEAPPLAPVPAPAAPLAEKAQSGSAVEMLKLYYALLEAGDYAAAYRLREPSPRAASADAFAAAYADYAEYRGAVSSASEPVTSDGWDYVEVAVQIIGRTKAGRPFSSAGTVTLRRRSGSTQWLISPR